MKLYISILFSIGFILFAQSQNKISGKITNSQNEPLLGVTVYIEELQKGTSTNENGTYELTNLPSNAIKMTVAYIGYKTQVKNIALSAKETTLNFTLEEAVFKMDEVIVSTVFNKLQSQNVMKVEHESIKTLQRKGT
ncbi:MAG: carboxypeptidase-like regulatory domain-containing protein, partial [Lutibacter sp.]|nr:carboxypeptidase-like regulatory domain-containing protein [Lutibacter sp.]